MQSAKAVFRGACAVALFLQSAFAGDIPFRRDEAGETNVTQVAWALLACGAILALVLWFLRRRGLCSARPATAMGPGLRVSQRARLSTKVALAVIDFEGERHLIVHGEQFAVVVAHQSQGRRQPEGCSGARRDS